MTTPYRPRGLASATFVRGVTREEFMAMTRTQKMEATFEDKTNPVWLQCTAPAAPGWLLRDALAAAREGDLALADTLAGIADVATRLPTVFGRPDRCHRECHRCCPPDPASDERPDGAEPGPEDPLPSERSDD